MTDSQPIAAEIAAESAVPNPTRSSVPDASRIPLSLYIHIPWCVKKCPYCDFNSHAVPGATPEAGGSRVPEAAYVDALLLDFAQESELALGRRIDTVFFGGGTPSLFSPDAIGRILDGANRLVPFARDVEVTMEANPGTVEHGCFDGYRAAGVNRVSFGVQSFDDDKLRRLGRIHGSDEARHAVRLAREGGIERINLDLMYALPQQTLAGAIADVEAALALEPEHVSHYQLTLEPNTLFAAKPPPLPGHDDAWDMQEACQRLLAEAGYAQYEVSAYAKPGEACRHNLNYWHFGDYFGIGAGAHGKLTQGDGSILRRWKKKLPRSYLEHAAGDERIGGEEALPRERLPFEFALNALRLNAGFDLTELVERTGLEVAAIEPQLEVAIARGLLTRNDTHVQPTERGRNFLNDAIELFLP